MAYDNSRPERPATRYLQTEEIARWPLPQSSVVLERVTRTNRVLGVDHDRHRLRLRVEFPDAPRSSHSPCVWFTIEHSESIADAIRAAAAAAKKLAP